MLIDENEESLAEFEELDLNATKCNSEILENVQQLEINPNKDVCLVLFSTDILASILTCQNLFEIKVKRIYVQVINDSQKKVIKNLGGEVTFLDINEVTAEKIDLEIVKKLEINYVYNNYCISKIKNTKIKNKKLADLNIRKKRQINIILIVKEKKGKKEYIMPEPDTIIDPGDTILFIVHKYKIPSVKKIF